MNESPFDRGSADTAKRSPATAGKTEHHQVGIRTLQPVKLCGTFLALLVLPALCLGQHPRSSRGREAGRALGGAKQSFASHCAPCHGLDGRGGEHAPAIVGTPAAAQRTDRELARIIRHGIPDKGMPSFHFLTNQQIENIVSYIEVLRGSSNGAANLKGDPAVGARLFFGEARCSECHMMQGKGGFMASDLTDFGRTHSEGEIREMIVQPNKVPDAQAQMVRIDTKSGQTLSGLVRTEDNFSIALLSQDGTFHLLMKSEIAAITREPRSMMPDDYGRKLSSQQLDDLASFLILGSTHRRPPTESAGSAHSK